MALFLSERALEDLTEFESQLVGLSQRIVDRNTRRFSTLEDSVDTTPNPNTGDAPSKSKGPNWSAGSVYKYCRGVLTKLFGA